MQRADTNPRPAGSPRVRPMVGRTLPWLRRLGVGAFLFFLIKGLLWLTVPALLTYFAAR